MKFCKTILIIILIFLCSISGKAVENSSDKLDFQLSYQLWKYENPAFTLYKKTSVDHNVLKVSIRFQSMPDPKTIHYLESLGTKFDYLNNKILHVGRIYDAYIPIDKLRILVNNAQILNIESADKSNHISTMNVSTDETQARLTWDYFNEQGLPLNGKDITIAIDDEPADIFHPAFWRADGDTFKWFDQNGNKKFDSGIDGVDLNFNNTIETNEYLAFIKAHIRDPWDIFSDEDSEFLPDRDWLYNDTNNNNQRDFGPKSGFIESDPTYGEQVFICMDLNKNNSLDINEPLIALKTCKIKAIYTNFGWDYDNHQWIYKTLIRGQNLIKLPEYSGHATAAAGILTGGCPGTHIFTGIAPEAEIIIGPPAWAEQMGADIILYESGVYINKFLDGSSNEEEAIDSLAARGILQVVPAGNLNTVHRHLQVEIAAQDSIFARIQSPDAQFNPGNPYLVTLLWRDPDNNPEFYIISPENDLFKISGAGADHSLDNFNIWSKLSISARNTAKMDIGVFRASGISGTWKIKIINKNSSKQLIDGYIFDGPFSFLHGSIFGDYISKSRTVMVPATADSAIAVGSYNTRDLNGSFGELSAFSSVGPRIDEEQIIDICAPGNVIFTTNCHNADNSAFGGYHSVSGTSFSAPHVAGATALLLQLDSTLTTYKTKNILRTGAINDNFTGATPNESWGGGKLRILNSLRLLPQFKEQENKSEITPEDFFLFQNYPNPFNSVTTVNFSLPKSSRLTINIYNIKGQLIRTLFNGKGITGTHTLKWDASNLSSGIYFIKMTAEDFIGVKKCTVLK